MIRGWSRDWPIRCGSRSSACWRNRVASPSEIAEEIGAPLGNVSYHVRFLARVGLIELTSTKPRRGAVEHYYRAVGRVRVTDKAWAQVPDVVKSGLISATLDQVGRVIGAAASSGGFERSDAVVTRREMLSTSRASPSWPPSYAGLPSAPRRSSGRAPSVWPPPSGGEAEVDAGVVMMLFEGGEAQRPMQRGGRPRPAAPPSADARAGAALGTARARSSPVSGVRRPDAGGGRHPACPVAAWLH